MSTKNVNAENATEEPSPVRLPDGWEYRVDAGVDVFEHTETGLRVRIQKQYGQSMRHDDYEWIATIRRGSDGIGEPLTWGGYNDRDELRAVVAKFAAGTPDGDYDPSEHAPENVWEWECPQWPAVLGYDRAATDARDWRVD
jgi:hypothetical protein